MTDWKRKLAAYLHDPPSKVLEIREHENHARSLFRQAGFVDEEEIRRLSDTYAKPSDWAASAADRLPFPRSRQCSSVFDGVRAKFHHPLSPSEPERRIRFEKEFESAEAAQEADQTVQPAITEGEGWSEPELWRARFFAHWRLWEGFCVGKDRRFALLPADTRIPDHTIWTHMQVVSALDTCARGYGKNAVLEPAFLKLQLGGVQEFIGHARSTRDLWSGSYLLSWLMAAGLKAVAWEAGPDSIIFPNLKGQPLFDLHLRECLWSRLTLNEKNGWDHVKPANPAHITTPNLPNVFLAVVPRERAAALGALAAEAIEQEWQKIAACCWAWLDREGMFPDEEAGFTKAARKARFDHQAAHHLNIAWQATPWPDTLEGALALADGFDAKMPICVARERVLAVIRYATDTMPVDDRDGRFYEGGEDGPKSKLNNIGLGWSIILAANGWQLDATRSRRAFSGWSTGARQVGVFQNKDSLDGRSEAVAGGRAWAETAKAKGRQLTGLFKHDDWLGASTLIKRVWHLAYLSGEWKLPATPRSMPIPDTRQIAMGLCDNDDTDEPQVDTARGDSYFAVLALDGDSIGKWVSGENTPPIAGQLSDYADATGTVKSGAHAYFTGHGGGNFLGTPRPLSPSYHLQFSAALSAFALVCANAIVRHHKGKLIYSGGDDVLAMLPAGSALACARALRAAFRGEDPGVPGFACLAPGYLTCDDYRESTGKADRSAEKHIPIIVPGPAADCSVGIAIAHFKAPLQDTVRAANAAEKRAKQIHGKGAVAVTVLKRSGETVEWAARWDDGGVDAAAVTLHALHKKIVSGKFPYRLGELMAVYLNRPSAIARPMHPVDGFDLAAVFAHEVRTVLARQRGPAWDEGGPTFEREFTKHIQKWIAAILAAPLDKDMDPPHATSERLNDAIQHVLALCAYCGFAARQDAEPGAEKQP